MSKKYLAEFVGTFALSFVVLAAVSAGTAVPFAIPVMAGLVLGLFVYTIGSVSGCHINPAVTIGLLSLKKISLTDAIGYIVAQIVAAAAALVVAQYFILSLPAVAPAVFDMQMLVAEALGALFFTFGIAAVVKGNVPVPMSGLVVGGSLVLGILISALSGAAGILNPAVAFALGFASLAYIIGPVLGALLGFNLYYYLTK